MARLELVDLKMSIRELKNKIWRMSIEDADLTLEQAYEIAGFITSIITSIIDS